MVNFITDATFETEVLKSDTLVVVDFYADWCGPCKVIAPMLDAISKEISDVKIVKINIDENQEYAGKFSVRSIPTLIAFKDGNHVDTRVGAGNKNDLLSWINQVK